MDERTSNEPVIDPEEILEGIKTWVDIETPSHLGEEVNKLVDLVEKSMQALGTEIIRVPGRDGYGDILKAKTSWGHPGEEKGILVLSHLDTVHPMDTINDPLPWKREGDHVQGPGIYDMKAGAHMAYYAFQHLVRQGKSSKLPITFLYVPEEEVGSPTSQAMIEDEAKKHKYVLVTEPARDGNKCVTERKGSGRFQIRALGRQAHSGLRHQDGRSAILEIARQVVDIETMTDYDKGVTLNVGEIQGGTGINVVPGECVIGIDLRMPTPELAEEYVDKILNLKPYNSDVELEITGGLNRPPYKKDEGIRALYEHARGLAAEIGFDLQDTATGGGSDGNFTAALSIPTLDGLGADGHGAHTLDETIYFSSIEPMTKLWVRLFETLE
tara:strand:+ start:1314 stop:2465 length:1152 start_codon:yes stop_codon:yes gene_type:complete